MQAAVEFLADPPLDPLHKAGYGLLFRGAVAITPVRIRRILGMNDGRRGHLAGRMATASLRWAMGSSPSWHLALVRTGCAVPPGLFRQPLPATSGSDVSSERGGH